MTIFQKVLIGISGIAIFFAIMAMVIVVWFIIKLPASQEQSQEESTPLAQIVTATPAHTSPSNSKAATPEASTTEAPTHIS